MMCLLCTPSVVERNSIRGDIIGKTMHGLVCGTGRSSFFHFVVAFCGAGAKNVPL